MVLMAEGRKAPWYVMGLFLLAGTTVTGQEVSLSQQLATTQRDAEKLRILLERTQGDYDRCKQDLAELWVQGRELAIKHQQLLKEQEDRGSSAPSPQAPPAGTGGATPSVPAPPQ
jgi:hypothetical protein